MARVNFAVKKIAVKNRENPKTLYKNGHESSEIQVIHGQKSGQNPAKSDETDIITYGNTDSHKEITLILPAKTAGSGSNNGEKAWKTL